MQKPTLILLPGLLCDAALWGPQTAALADIADIAVADLTQGDSMGAMADAVLRAAPPKFALAGLSMGGYVAFEVMRRAPQRIEKLALLDTSARPDTPEQKKARHDLMALARQGDFKGVTPRLLPRWVHPSRVTDRTLAETVTTMTQRVGREAFLRQQTAIMNRPDSRPGLVDIACPTLVLCGHDDQSTPLDRHREIAADIADARLVVVPECGHLSTLERPEIVNREMRAWLGGN
ncbi:MAG TPA: alpha/beta fold hydrolase [Alphaproteobacteria bacterium]|nr:alpha/beta fold hydrolase [Alphaproteobacteria bacterium]